jgi:hypothetical protein
MSKLPLLPLVAALAFQFSSCSSSSVQKTEMESVTAQVVAEPAKTPVLTVFNPAVISPQQFNATKLDISNFIKTLNEIIQKQDYNRWISYLSDNYLKTISSPAFLEEKSNTDILKARNIRLENSRDYFYNVVVPSRYHDRVDDIAFVSENRVKAFTLVNGQRLRLYDLEKVDDQWKILN